MSILCDWEIKALSLGDQLIEPFVDHVVREENNRNILSYGLGSYGYDIRLSPKQCLLFGGTSAGICDPKGLIFGLMPHPEASLFQATHRIHHKTRNKNPIQKSLGQKIFDNIVDHLERR